MMEYYDTTEEVVTEVASNLKTSRQLTHALLERGHDEKAIRAMSPDDRFREFCEWKGLIGWADTLICVLKEARAIQ